MKRKPSDYVVKKTKTQMLRPITFCPVMEIWCRFHIEGFCLEEYKPYACPARQVDWKNEEE